jgi:GTP-binding nuclear protein Ran
VFNTTSRGLLRLEVWDISGQELYGGRCSEYYTGGDGAILMFDVNDRESYKNVPNWYKDVKKGVGRNIPIVLVGNKTDIEGHHSKIKHITFHLRNNIPFYRISIKADRNTEEPFLGLARKLLGDDSLQFVQAIRPHEIELNATALAAQLDQLAIVPDDDDDDDV